MRSLQYSVTVLFSLFGLSNSILVLEYTDPQCTHIKSGLIPHDTPNGQCLADPLNPSTSSKVTCSSDNTWSFDAYLNSNCDGGSLFHQSGLANDYCLNVVGSYIKVDCTQPSSGIPSIGSSSNASQLQPTADQSVISNNITSTNNTYLLLITVPVYNATQYNYSIFNNFTTNNTDGSNTQYYTQTIQLPNTQLISSNTSSTSSNSNTTLGALASLLSSNATTSNINLFNLLNTSHTNYTIYSDYQSTTLYNTSALLINQINGLQYNSTNNSTTIIQSIYNLLGPQSNLTRVSIYNDTLDTNSTTLYHTISEIYHIAPSKLNNSNNIDRNATLDTVIAYVPQNNKTQPITYTLISQYNLTDALNSVLNANTTANSSAISSNNSTSNSTVPFIATLLYGLIQE